MQRDTKDTVRYRQDTGGIRAEYPKNTRQGRARAGTHAARVLLPLIFYLIRLHNELTVV